MLDPQLNIIPEQIETIHIMGICGTGMAALAGMLQKSGYQITGSDANVYPPMSTLLAEMGIPILEGYSRKNLDHNPDLVIVGNVITKKHEEACALADKKIPYLSFPQALAAFFISAKRSLVVAGTHGKTTTCSLLATTLYHAGMDPGFMIGGIVSEFASNNRIGTGDYFITEGDEYDTAFFDKGSKFLHYQPEIAIITSIEFDHADIFNNIDEIKHSFSRFVQKLPEHGLIVACGDDKNVRDVTENAPCKVIYYGFETANDYTIDKLDIMGRNSTFSYTHKDKSKTLTLPLTGRHNCLNGLAVTIVLETLSLSQQSIQEYLLQFTGVKRRQEIRGVVDDITVIDDFAHHPTAVTYTLEGLKRAFPDQRLVAVFEPRTNSSRRAIFQQEYTKSFDHADLVVLKEPIPLANMEDEQLFSSKKLAEDLANKGTTAIAFATTEELLTYLQKGLKQGDIVAILSNGGFDNIHEKLLAALETRKIKT